MKTKFIPIFNSSRQISILKDEIKREMEEVLNNGNFILGKKVSEFEAKFAEYIGVKYAVGVASGTDAISLALLAVGIESGFEVIMPANSYPSVFALTQIGAVPKLVDVNPETHLIDPGKIEKAINKKTKAILPVHLFGQAAAMEEIISIGRKHNIPVIEDCAQAHGAEIRIQNKTDFIKAGDAREGSHTKMYRSMGYASGRTRKSKSITLKAGSVGDAGCFSFYPTKNLGCYGDGGMVVTNNKDIFKKVKLLRMYGEEKRYKSIILGRNSRLDELQAAILLLKLKYLDKWNRRRREIAKLYDSGLKNKDSRMVLPFEADYGRSVYHLYVIRVKNRDKLKAYLESKCIQTGIHYPTPIHLQPSFKYLGYKKGDFPVSEKASNEILSLPMFPELENNEIEKIVCEIKNFYLKY